LYSIGDVWAEKEGNAATAGGVIGGLVGLIGGPLGAFIGAGIGATLGGVDDTEEQKKVNNFNNSW
jgi:outer membrane lipoprotein SlyB